MWREATGPNQDAATLRRETSLLRACSSKQLVTGLTRFRLKNIKAERAGCPQSFRLQRALAPSISGKPVLYLP